MKNKLLLYVSGVVFFIVTVLMVARLSVQKQPVTSHGGPVKDYVSFIDNLRAQGTEVKSQTNNGESLSPIFQEKAKHHLLTINNIELSVYEFATKVEAEQASLTVSSDGYSTTTAQIEWIAPPHWYRKGTIIIVYAGNDTATLQLFEKVLGPQFAGQE